MRSGSLLTWRIIWWVWHDDAWSTPQTGIRDPQKRKHKGHESKKEETTPLALRREQHFSLPDVPILSSQDCSVNQQGESRYVSLCFYFLVCHGLYLLRTRG